MVRLRLLVLAVVVVIGIRVYAQPQAPERGQLPLGVQVERDIEYVKGGGPSQTLDVYIPRRRGEPRPCVVWIHGGGWTSGDKDRAPAVPLVMRGYVVVSINYRLSQEARFPAQIDDCREAIRFIRENATRYGILSDRIAVWGGSAGAHLAALLGTDPAKGAEVQAVIDAFGPADLRNIVEQAGHKRATKGPVESLLGGSAAEVPDVAAQASPITHVSSDDPPFLIVHGTADPIVPIQQSDALAEKLKGAGVEVTLIRLEGAGHGGAQFHDREINQKQMEFLEKHLKGKTPSQEVRPSQGD